MIIYFSDKNIEKLIRQLSEIQTYENVIFFNK